MTNDVQHPDHYTWKGTALKDLMKARQYLDFLITSQEVKENASTSRMGKDED